MAARKPKQSAQKAGEPRIALLRGINVGGNRKVPMAQLRVLAQRLGWGNVTTYIQSGNVVFTANGVSTAAAEQQLEQAIELHFGFAVPVIVRSATGWLCAVARCPFAAAALERPNLVHLGFGKRPPRAAAAKDLAPYCKTGERVAVRGDAIWIDYAAGVARSKLTPAVLDRVIGSTVTLRNVKTVQAIGELLRAAGDPVGDRPQV
jgi:uncharacterized protein (DUF1697 family)